MPKVAFVSGHLNLSEQEFSDHYVEKISEAHALGHTFVVGDARGADARALQFIGEIFGTAVVFHMFEAARNNPHAFPTRGGFQTDDLRDEAMSKASDYDIAWVRPGRETSGTAANIERRKQLSSGSHL